MDNNQINNYIDRFENSSLSLLEIKNGDFSLKLAKENAVKGEIPVIQEKVDSPKTSPERRSSGEVVKSPIVGVYYESPTPEDEPFVKIGDKVTAGQVICLVEAMKMMNELKSPVDGIIKAIYGENGNLVQYDQILFEVEPC